MSEIRVVLADDHNLVRAGIRSLLKEIPEIQVVGEAEDGGEAVELVRNQRPDLVIMDVAMKSMNGLDAAEKIKKEYPEVRVIILSMHLNEEYVLKALRAGVSGYILKDAVPQELVLAVKAIMRGESYLSPPVSRQVVEGYVQRVEGEPARGPLTARQLEILKLIAEGHGTKEIAFRLNLSTKTVETHRAQIMERLNIRDVVGLVRYAIRTGLVRADQDT